MPVTLWFPTELTRTLKGLISPLDNVYEIDGTMSSALLTAPGYMGTFLNGDWDTYARAAKVGCIFPNGKHEASAIYAWVKPIPEFPGYIYLSHEVKRNFRASTPVKTIIGPRRSLDEFIIACNADHENALDRKLVFYSTQRQIDRMERSPSLFHS